MVDFVFLSNIPNSCKEPFLLQIIVSSLAAIITKAYLNPLGVPQMISQIFAGIVLGPTFLGRLSTFREFTFPQPNTPTLKSFVQYGLIFEVLIIGIQTDPTAPVKVGRKAYVIGISVVTFGLASAVSFSSLISATGNTHGFVPLNVSVPQTLVSFPVIASYLHQQNIINSELSRIAFSVSIISGTIDYFLRVFGSTLLEAVDYKLLLSKVLGVAIVVPLVRYLLRPAIRYMVKHSPEGVKIKQVYLITVLVIAVFLCWISDSLMVHYYIGTLVFGMLIPAGSSFGIALVSRLEYFTTWVVMPAFFTVHGLMVDMYDVKLRHALLVVAMYLVTWIGKFIGAVLPAQYYNLSRKDATILGLIINTQGFVEIAYFGHLLQNKLIDRESYSIMCLTPVIVNGVLSKVVRNLYESSLKFKLPNRRTIEHSESDTELRILTCISDEESVPSVVHLLKAMHPTKERPIYATIIHLVELVGRTVPLIISHRSETTQSDAIADSQGIMNVFLRGFNDQQSFSLDPYTVVSPYATMHNDICMLAIQKKTSFIILPFHMQFPAGVSNYIARAVNCNVFEQAPCSAGIVVHRGRHSGLKYVYGNWTTYHILVLFFGRADDREAVALAARMCRNPTIQITVMRFIQSDSLIDDSDIESNTGTTETMYDDEVISEFIRRTANNKGVKYTVVEVDTYAGVFQVIEAIGDTYDLVIMGRHEQGDVELVVALSEWQKSSELGPVGDLFTSSGYGGDASILVVQQQQPKNTSARF